jgi:hypothetical protein
MTYRVSTKPDGTHRWWRPGETIPAEHTAIRDAREDEAAVMDEILRQDGEGRMPDLALGARVAALMDQH